MLWRTSERNEHPVRLEVFLRALRSVSWASEARLTSLNDIFIALNELIHHEVVFYYNARKRQRLWSVFTRGVAFALGTAGILAPLLAAADPPQFKEFGSYGYSLIAAAAATLVVNRLFGATGGHVRYVEAQFALEQLMTTLRLDWQHWLAKNTSIPADQLQVAEAFALLKTFSDASYKVITEETKIWGQGISSALEEYAKSLPSKPGAPSNKP